MKSARGRHKTREPETSVSSANLNIVLQVVPIEESKILLNHMQDPVRIRDNLHQYLENPQRGLVHRPKRLGAVSLHSKPGNISLVVNPGRFDKRSICGQSTNQPSIHLPGEFNPETDLWYAAFLDYLIEGINWAVHVWIPSCDDDFPGNNEHSRLVNVEQPGLQLPKDDKALAISLVVATMLVLIGHMQRQSETESKSVDGLIVHASKNSTNLVDSICFIKNFFQNIPQGDRNLDYQTADLEEFERHHCGMLGALKVNASIQIIHYLAYNFLHLYRLVEKCFRLTDTNRQKLIEVPCSLRMHTLPRTFGTIKSVWPPPLCEALSLSVIAKYQHLFDERATKWLPCLPLANLPSPAESVSGRTSPPVEAIETVTEVNVQPPIKDPLEKYLTTLDQMGKEQWELLASISEDQTQEAVQAVLTDLATTKELSVHAKFTEQLRDFQLKLARLLVERSRQKLDDLVCSKA